MAAPIRVRDDFTAAQVRASARAAKDPAQVRRLLAISAILEGFSRSDAPSLGGVTLKIVRDWVLRFNAAGPDGLATRKSPGPHTILNDNQRRALAGIIEAGPIASVHRVVRWWIIDLVQWLWDELGVSISKQALGRELRAMGFRKLSARPRHQGQRLQDIADSKLPHPSACSTGWWALIPPDDGRAFHAIMGSISTASWATIPRDRGHFWPTV